MFGAMRARPAGRILRDFHRAKENPPAIAGGRAILARWAGLFGQLVNYQTKNANSDQNSRNKDKKSHLCRPR
jgi:hypothetical protein